MGFGYYETIAGGSGAGPTWNGTSGVHTHMTNTRITDAEVFERRYPVLLREFSLRRGSGGKGQHPGGDGVIRDIEFRIPVHVSILSERRVYHPYGLAGGEDAACGLNLWVRKVRSGGKKFLVGEEGKGKGESKDENANADEPQEQYINLGGKNTALMQRGERIIVMTPGGGGWGPVGGKSQLVRERDAREGWRKGSLAQRTELQESV